MPPQVHPGQQGAGAGGRGGHLPLCRAGERLGSNGVGWLHGLCLVAYVLLLPAAAALLSCHHAEACLRQCLGFVLRLTLRRFRPVLQAAGEHAEISQAAIARFIEEQFAGIS